MTRPSADDALRELGRAIAGEQIAVRETAEQIRIALHVGEISWAITACVLLERSTIDDGEERESMIAHADAPDNWPGLR